MQNRNIPDRTERRDVPPGQERSASLLQRSDTDTMERRNDPSGRERSLPPQQSRNDPSGEERIVTQTQAPLESSVMREIPGRGTESEESMQQTDGGVRQIPGGASSSESVQASDDRATARVVTGSQEAAGTACKLSQRLREIDRYCITHVELIKVLTFTFTFTFSLEWYAGST